MEGRIGQDRIGQGRIGETRQDRRDYHSQLSLLVDRIGQERLSSIGQERIGQDRIGQGRIGETIIASSRYQQRGQDRRDYHPQDRIRRGQDRIRRGQDRIYPLIIHLSSNPIPHQEEDRLLFLLLLLSRVLLFSSFKYTKISIPTIKRQERNLREDLEGLPTF